MLIEFSTFQKDITFKMIDQTNISTTIDWILKKWIRLSIILKSEIFKVLKGGGIFNIDRVFDRLISGVRKAGVLILLFLTCDYCLGRIPICHSAISIDAESSSNGERNYKGLWLGLRKAKPSRWSRGTIAGELGGANKRLGVRWLAGVVAPSIIEDVV